MSRTIHHDKRYRKQQMEKNLLPWWKLTSSQTSWIKQQWSSEVRSSHKQEMFREPEDPSLTKPRRISNLWDWF